MGKDLYTLITDALRKVHTQVLDEGVSCKVCEHLENDKCRVVFPDHCPEVRRQMRNYLTTWL